jgi:hypothetical protein
VAYKGWHGACITYEKLEQNSENLKAEAFCSMGGDIISGDVGRLFDS